MPNGGAGVGAAGLADAGVAVGTSSTGVRFISGGAGTKRSGNCQFSGAAWGAVSMRQGSSKVASFTSAGSAANVIRKLSCLPPPPVMFSTAPLGRRNCGDAAQNGAYSDLG